MLIDTHAHLTDRKLNAQEIILNMKSDNLDKIITVGYDVLSSSQGVELAQQNKNVYAAVGLHPNDINDVTEKDFERIIELSKNKKVVAWGEIGLDYHYKDTDKAKQRYWLIKQIEAAKTAKLPIIFHLRDAYGDMQNIIIDNKNKFENGAVMHCFSGSKETAKFYTDLGFYISFAGPVTFKNADYSDIIKTVPLDRLLIETDCPYLTPHPFRGQINQPQNVKYVALRIAEVLNKDVEFVQDLIKENADRLFRFSLKE